MHLGKYLQQSLVILLMSVSLCSDVNKDWTHKDHKDKDQSYKDKDKD